MALIPCQFIISYKSFCMPTRILEYSEKYSEKFYIYIRESETQELTLPTPYISQKFTTSICKGTRLRSPTKMADNGYHFQNLHICPSLEHPPMAEQLVSCNVIKVKNALVSSKRKR